MPRNDWNAYKELFLHEMKENGKQTALVNIALEQLRQEVAAVKVDIGGLKVKAAIAGGMAGVVGTALVTLVFSLLR